MSALTGEEGVWFVYDGECPVCTHAAQALRIKKVYGKLNLVNARETASSPLVQEINQRGLDLDEGMVIVADGLFYHGKDALKFMARYGDSTNVFMTFCKGLFWSEMLSRILYPWMRATRNWLLRRKQVRPLDNLCAKQDPIFKTIFGESWDQLPPVIKKHYANRPYTDDVTVVQGTLDVMCKAPLTWLALLLTWMGQIPARNENDVATSVHFQSDINTKAFHFIRRFHFKKTRHYVFHSRMLQIDGNEVIEIMGFGLGWKLRYSWDGQKVILSHQGYALSLFGHSIPLPLTMLIGKGYAEEWAVDDNTFAMITHITHPLWGKIYEYKGHFEVSS